MNVILNQLPTFAPDTICLDIETFGKDPFSDKLALVQIAVPGHDDVYVLDSYFGRIAYLVNNEKILKVVHGGGFDFRWLLNLGMKPRNVWDTLIIERVLTAGTMKKCGLDDVCLRRLKLHLDKSVRNRFVAGRRIDRDMVEYAARDAYVLAEIHEQQKRDVKREKLERVAEIENRIIVAVAEMQNRGIGLNLAEWDAIKVEETKLRDAAYVRGLKHFPNSGYMESLFEDGGIRGNVNFNSVRLKDNLASIGINVEDTMEGTLLAYLTRNPKAEVLNDILEYREHETALGFEYEKYVNSVTGKIHAEFNPMGADTARFSSSVPNLQQVKRESRFRKMFVPASGRLFCTADYSQLELRIMADVSGCKAMVSAFADGRDLHAELAESAYGTPITKDQRRIAKNTNFAKIFGAGPEKLAQTIRIPLNEARKISAAFDRSYPEINRWGNKQFEFLCNNGFIADRVGRKRWFPDVIPSDNGWGRYGKYKNIARNTPIQGIEASIVKDAFYNLWKAGYDLVLTVHDEFVAEIDDPKDGERIKEIMVESGNKFMDRVKLGAEYQVAPNWVK